MKIKKIYKHAQKDLKIIQSNSLPKIKMSVLIGLIKSKNSKIILSSGLRDNFLAAILILLRVKYDIYCQVPYHKAMTIKDIPHYIMTIMFLKLTVRFAKNLYTNSNECLPSNIKRKKVLLPINKDELIPLNSNLINTNGINTKNTKFISASRLNIEKGIGSRDINTILSFLKSCKAKNKKNYKIVFHHYGEVDQSIKQIFLNENLPIVFNGFSEDWVKTKCDGYIFASNYEGFGLSAFEAANTGRKVFVNEAFPEELIHSNPNIMKLDSKDFNIDNILKFYVDDNTD